MSDENNLYYMRARFYSPEIKRFVNQDVLLGNVGEGQSLNRFAYVRGRVISRIDPFGLEDVSGDYSNGFTDESTRPICKVFKRIDEYPTYGQCETAECSIWGGHRGNDNMKSNVYVGAGGYVDTHYILIGVDSEIAKIYGGEKACTFQTDCVSIGPGFFMGGGVALSFGVAMDDIEKSLAGSSVGFSFDIGYCFQSYGVNVSDGYNENGITSIGSSKGAGRAGGGCGISFTLHSVVKSYHKR